MGLRSWFIEWLEAGRMKNEPDRQTEAYPFPFYWFGGKTNQPVMKRTPANLRLLSESPIPRRAINVIKDGISRLDWSVAAIDENDQEKYAEACKLITRTLRKPNQTDSFRLWLEQIVEDMLVASAGAAEIAKAGDKMRPLRLFPVDGFSIELYPNWDGKKDSYRYAQRLPNGTYVHLTDDELMYIRMNPRTNTPFGLSPLETVWESVNNFIAAHKNAGNQAKNTFIRKILNLGKTADAKAVALFRAYWEAEVQGKGVPPIIGGENPSVLDLGATDDKALFIEWQRFLIEIVAIAFGVSPKKLGQTKDVNRSTADSEDEDTNATIQSIADTISEYINDKIIDDYFGLGDVIQFKFIYAQSLKDQKTQAEIDQIYLDRKVFTVDEVRGSKGKKTHPNKHGEVVLLPGSVKSIDINKPMEEQEPPPESTPLPPNEPVKARRMKAEAFHDPIVHEDTRDAEEEFIAAYLLLMAMLLRRGDNVTSIDSLLYVWTPTHDDFRALSDALYDLKEEAWLTSYNRRRAEMGEEKLSELPDEVKDDIRKQSDDNAKKIMDTYEEELRGKLADMEKKYADLTGSEKEKAIADEMGNWLTRRMTYKSSQISDYEAGLSWNEALFAHDDKYAPYTEYYVQPVATNHEDCANIIAGAPYTKDTLPAPLPLHPNCPHRYFAVVHDTAK
ncbi:phage portal protein [Paenibacillus thermotolerans]|uniref:phage portal protein n=1 Tax=Paenibacillus thermotolerans TaxID=3027807 RepID=UPI002367F91F|nr:MULTISPECIES: phage portal protein [unclassified Paenibacillus]